MVNDTHKTFRAACTAGPGGMRCLRDDCLACQVIGEEEAWEAAREEAEYFRLACEYSDRLRDAAPLSPGCPICGSTEATEAYDVCACGWERDPAAEANPDEYVAGPNHLTLNEARENYRRYSAADGHWASTLYGRGFDPVNGGEA